MREQLAENRAEIEQLKKMNNEHQQLYSLLQHKYDQLKQENQKLLEASRNQVTITVFIWLAMLYIGLRQMFGTFVCFTIYSLVNTTIRTFIFTIF